jgi:phosphoenolpyruvate carboxylase
VYFVSARTGAARHALISMKIHKAWDTDTIREFTCSVRKNADYTLVFIDYVFFSTSFWAV